MLRLLRRAIVQSMSLLQLDEPTQEAEIRETTDAATRTLSVAAVESEFVERVYEKLASVYDVLFGPTLHASRVEAIKRIGIHSGDRVLEVGVGTGINAPLYPRDCWVTGIDISASMLEKAQERVARRRTHHVHLLQMERSRPRFSRQLIRHRLCVVSDQRGARSGSGRPARCTVCVALADVSSFLTIS